MSEVSKGDATAVIDHHSDPRIFSVVLNHFSTADLPHLRASLLFAAALSIQNSLVREVIVVDGSSHRDEWLSHELTRLGVSYYHEGRVLGFAEGYNVGARLTTAPWVVLSASDVYPTLDFYQQVAAVIRQAGSAIGCIIPRLTVTDLPLQESRWAQQSVCSVPLMTLNLNVFERKTFFELGQVPECYSGAFNDVELSLHIRASRRQILMLPTICAHYGRLTWSTAASNYRYVNDRDVFISRFPHLAKAGGFWDIDIAAICGGRVGSLMRVAWALSPRRKRLGMMHLILRAIPFFRRWKADVPG